MFEKNTDWFKSDVKHKFKSGTGKLVLSEKVLIPFLYCLGAE